MKITTKTCQKIILYGKIKQKETFFYLEKEFNF